MSKQQKTIDPFDLEPLKMATFIAMTGSGKSHLMKHLLYRAMSRGDYNWVKVFSITKCNHFWSDIVGKDNVMKDFNEEWLGELLTAMDNEVDKNHGVITNPGLIIFDDMIGEARFSSKIATKLAGASRHFGLGV